MTAENLKNCLECLRVLASAEIAGKHGQLGDTPSRYTRISAHNGVMTVSGSNALMSLRRSFAGCRVDGDILVITDALLEAVSILDGSSAIDVTFHRGEAIVLHSDNGTAVVNACDAPVNLCEAISTSTLPTSPGMGPTRTGVLTSSAAAILVQKLLWATERQPSWFERGFSCLHFAGESIAAARHDVIAVIQNPVQSLGYFDIPACAIEAAHIASRGADMTFTVLPGEAVQIDAEDTRIRASAEYNTTPCWSSIVDSAAYLVGANLPSDAVQFLCDHQALSDATVKVGFDYNELVLELSSSETAPISGVWSVAAVGKAEACYDMSTLVQAVSIVGASPTFSVQTHSLGAAYISGDEGLAIVAPCN